MEGARLLADKNSNSWDFAEKIRKYILKEYEINIPLHEVKINSFRNKELDIEIPENTRKKDIYFIHDSSKDPQTWWVELLLIKDLLIRASAKSITLVLPHMMYTRKDWKDRPHVPISARAVADSISSGSERIITMDLHSPQIQGFYNIPVDSLNSTQDVVKYLNSTLENPEELVVVSPDVGGAKRARRFAQKLNSKYSLAIIEKRRDAKGEVDEMRLIGDVKDKNIIVADDIIDSGGTLFKAGELLKKEGAKEMICYGTHGIFTNNAGLKLPEIYNQVLTTDTIPKKQEAGIRIISVAETFGEVIYRAQKGRSISELFK